MYQSSRFIYTLIVLVIALAIQPAVAAAPPPLFTKEQIKEFSPRARDDLVDALVANQEFFRDSGLTTTIRLAHFFAQVATETGGMTHIAENMNYSSKRLLQVFSRKLISEQKALEIANKPQQIANWVYGERLGNRGRDTNDGWNYRGSGFIQLTGRANFRSRGGEIDLPLEDKPEIARQPKEGLMAAAAFWKARRINDPADDNDIRLVRIRVNGPAAHGLDASELWLPTARKVFRVAGTATEGTGAEESFSDEAVAAAEKKAAAKALETMGFIQTGAVESGGLTEESFTEGLRAYHRAESCQSPGFSMRTPSIRLPIPTSGGMTRAKVHPG